MNESMKALIEKAFFSKHTLEDSRKQTKKEKRESSRSSK